MMWCGGEMTKNNEGEVIIWSLITSIRRFLQDNLVFGAEMTERDVKLTSIPLDSKD